MTKLRKPNTIEFALQNALKNLTEEDIREVFNPDEYFSEYEFEYNPKECDLYFWGIKK